MKYSTILKLTLIFCLLFFSGAGLTGKPQFKEIKILGLKLLNERSLIQKAHLDKIPANENQFISISKKIAAFYQKNGYILVRTYLVQENIDKIIIFVDEGQIERIIFKRLDTIDTIKIKYEFELKERIYNKYIIEKEINRVKNKYKFKDVIHTLVPITEGEKAFFQLNEVITIPWLPSIRIPFFDEYCSRYNLEIEFIRGKSEQKTITYGIKTSYSKGFIPDLVYRHPDFLQKKDVFIIGSSIGLYYGFDLNFKNPPKWTFMEVHSEYYFSPIGIYFTPMASGSAYYSRASRKDLGIINYNYLKLRGIFAPGVTLLNNLHIYAGLGGERVFIFDPKTESDSIYAANINRHNDTWAVYETRIKLDARPWTLKKTKKQELEAVYNYYKNKKSFHESTIEWNGTIEFKNLDLYLFTIEFEKIWDRPPFYHEYSVSGANFKGFMGKSYYTRNVLRFANEYRISVYRDLYHIGLFTDITRFEGSGYDLNGYQSGFVAGIAGHIIFLDQFEFNIFFGKDYLFSKEESQYNIYLNAGKKW
ncbi:MAG: hypothetical protein V1874_00820 [Spirochaetota bacterium]